VPGAEQRADLARLNLKAAERAGASGGFAAAAHHYAAGIRFLRDEAWASHYDLMFRLHLGLAESEFLRGDHGTAEELFRRLLLKARTDVEQVQVYELISIYERQSGKYQEAVGTALKALALLGIKMDPEPKAPLILLDMLKTKRAIGGRSPGELLRLPEATEPRVLLAYRLLALATITAYFPNPILFARLGLKLTRMVVAHGNSHLAALGYSLYSAILATLGAYAEADVFGRLALELTERYPNKRVETLARGAYGGGVQFWRNPIRESYRYLDEACQCGLLSGELMQAGYALNATMRNLTHAGSALDFLRQTSERNQHLFRRINDDTAKQATQMYGQAALALQGLTRSLGSFDTDDFDEAHYATEVAALGTKLPLYYYWTSKVRVLYILERREEALAISKGARRGADQVLGCIIDIVDYRFYDALLLASFADQKGVLARQRDLFLIRGHLRKLKTWAKNAPMNFRHKYLLVAAELSRVTEDDHAAIGQYEEAIKLARENEFLQDEAIALELAGKFYQSRGLPEFAFTYLARARKAYARWGALAKVALLDQAYPELSARAKAKKPTSSRSTDTMSGTYTTQSFDVEDSIAPTWNQPELDSTTTSDASWAEITSTTSSDHGSLDVVTVLKASQAFATEMDLQHLVDKVLRIAVENAGAERGVLLLQQGGQLLVKAEYSSRDDKGTVLHSEALSDTAAVPPAIVRLALRTQSPVVLADAIQEGSFATEPYVLRERPRSVLCTPILHQSDVKGVLYLENNLAPGAFTDDRIQLLNVLSSQMAISLENAFLYADLERIVVERTRELRKAQARVVALEKEATEVRMAGGFAHEMRNALTGAKVLLDQVHSGGTGDGTSTLCLETSRMLKDLYVELKHHVPPETRTTVVTLLREINGNEQAVDTIVRDVGDALTRALASTQAILEYARLGKARPGADPVPLRSLVASILKESEGDFAAHGISVEVMIAPESVLPGQEIHFYSILKNLILNARDALVEQEDRRHRSITISLTEEPNVVVLRVVDTGPGILPEDRDRIFEPFFTTKPAQGTGLGLGVVRKLVSLYKGAIDIESEPGRGTTFQITFPRLEATPDEKRTDVPRTSVDASR
jgi:signal transduction histidine kinase/tetratricopeptide (TPR) repeat protein